MDIIIVGCGRVGSTLAEKLNNDGNDITVVDISAEKVQMLVNRYDVMGVVGNGATQTVLKEAGIETAELLIAVTNSDELNLLCCLLAKKQSNCQTIARVKNPEYSKESPYFKAGLGLAMIINPEYAAAEEIARLLRFPSALKIEPFAKGKVEIIKFKLPADSAIVGMSVKDLMTKYRANVIVCTIERGEEAYIANGNFVFAEKDVVSIIASPKNANEFFTKINYKGRSVKDALIAGGGVITHYLCEILERSQISLKVVEKDVHVCEELAAKWPKLTVIHGNASDRELLMEEGIAQADAFVALCGRDAENIMLSLYAKDAGCKKQVTILNYIEYDGVINRLDLDATICPKDITADLILRYVRATKNAKGSNVETLYSVIQDEVEAAEFIIKENSPIAGIALKDLKLKKDVLIASISRGEEVIMPRGSDVIETGDAVVIVSKHLGLHDVADVLR
ncbi:MAG: Trk system potassium transporter TrkA [Clostridia bacterium]|nr:Trk system potassium transporter TrkA [Clostridia bacterium]